jgi:hypothetical protein
MPVIPALGGGKRTESSRLAWATIVDPVSKKKKVLYSFFKIIP